MARNSKNKKIARKNKKLRYRKGGPARLDMRKGGRVALQTGGGGSTTKKPKRADEDITLRKKRKKKRREEE